MYRHFLIVFVCLSCLVVVSACGPSRGTIKGTVSYKNSPLTHGEVCFRGSDGATHCAEIRDDGSYEARGVLYGEVLVSVRQLPKDYLSPAEARKAWKEKGLELPPDYVYSPPRSPWAAKYADLETSGLTVTVSKAIVQFDIPLTEE